MDSLYEYMRVLASHTLNSLVLPPDGLWDVLVKVQNERHMNPQMQLVDNPKTSGLIIQLCE